MEQMSVLSHDLNSVWGIISWAAQEFKRSLSQADYHLYEGVLGRGKRKLLLTLDQLAAYPIQPELLEKIIQLTDKLNAENSSSIALELDPLIKTLQKRLRELS